MKIRLVKTTEPSFKPLLARILNRRGNRRGEIERRVESIVRAIQRRGDRSLLHYTRVFDGLRLTRSTLEVKSNEVEQAVRKVPEKDLRTLRLAAKRITAFHRRQLQKSWQYRDPLGMLLGQRITPLARVGVYVPAGKASYPSTVLMNVIPAKVAGVKEIIMTSPIGNDGAIILAAANIAGVDRIFRVGGAQAIAALAFGTRSIPKVDKIVGPGNIFVATAKRLVFGEVDIDSIAGPSEILLLVDESADPQYVAADMLSQAEHDELAAALCVTTSMSMALKVQKAVEEQLRETKRQAITIKSLEKYGAIIVARGRRESQRDCQRRRSGAHRVDRQTAAEVGAGHSQRRSDVPGSVFGPAFRGLFRRAEPCVAYRWQRPLLFTARYLRFSSAHHHHPSREAGVTGAGTEDYSSCQA